MVFCSSALHSHSQSELVFDHSLSILCLSVSFMSFPSWAIIDLIIPLAKAVCFTLTWARKHELIHSRASGATWFVIKQWFTFCVCLLHRSWCQKHPIPNTSGMAYCECDVCYTLSSSNSREAPIRGPVGRMQRSLMIGASCYLQTTAARLAGPLYV